MNWIRVELEIGVLRSCDSPIRNGRCLRRSMDLKSCSLGAYGFDSRSQYQSTKTAFNSNICNIFWSIVGPKVTMDSLGKFQNILVKNFVEVVLNVDGSSLLRRTLAWIFPGQAAKGNRYNID